MDIVIGQETPKDPNFIPLATVKKNTIPNSRGMELLPIKQKIAFESFSKAYPKAVFRSATSTYNCLGLIFASRRTRIDPNYLRMILDDDGYKKLSDADGLREGDVVVYKTESNQEITHVAMVHMVNVDLTKAKRSFVVLSKWGDHGEYFHPIEELPPILGKPFEYWTDRRAIQ